MSTKKSVIDVESKKETKKLFHELFRLHKMIVRQTAIEYFLVGLMSGFILEMIVNYLRLMI